MRFAFFDESGIGKMSAEPFTVVGGFLLHVDEQYEPLRKFILDMADDLVGTDRPLDFVFHAKELFNGGGFFPREEWPQEKRHAILGHLCDIPTAFEFQVFFSCIERARHPAKNPDAKDAVRRATRRCHLLTFLSCLQQLDDYMEAAFPDEKAFVVVEDHTDHRGFLRDGAALLGNKRLQKRIEDDPRLHWRPYRFLVEQPLFQEKSGQSPLQVADACAYVIAKHLKGDERAAPFIEKLKPRMPAGWRTEFFRVHPATS